MGLTPVSANLLGLSNAALYPSGAGTNNQATVSSGASPATDVATLSSSPGSTDASSPGLYNLPNAVIFRIQLDRLAFEASDASGTTSSNPSTGATSNAQAADSPENAHGGGKLRKALEALGFDPKTVDEFLRLAKELKRSDPAGYRDFVQQIENLANALESSAPATTPATSGTSAPAAAAVPQDQAASPSTQPSGQDTTQPTANPAGSGSPALQFQVDVTSFQLTETQVQITETQGQNGQTLSVTAESLNLNFTELQAAFAQPQAGATLQQAGDGESQNDSQSQGSQVNVNA